MSADLENLRNFGVIAHIDAGKTTVTERMLFYSGQKHRVGSVDKGTTETDFDPEEQNRGITIYSAAVSFPWKDVTINLIDTPGHVDFTAEVERSLRVLDGGVVVFSAREGVEAQSETVWHQADKYHVPRLAFINKMDREGADFYETLDEIRERLNVTAIPVNLPLGAGPTHLNDAFRGVIDLIEMKLLSFTGDHGTEIVVGEIPEESREEAEVWRDEMLEKLSEFDDELLELVLDDQPVPEDLIRSVIRRATLKQGDEKIVPVLCGSALGGIGVQPILDAVAAYLPSPVDMPPVEGLDPKKKGDVVIRRKPDLSEPFCGLLFKIVADRHGDLHYVRVYSGELKSNSRVYNPGKDKKENVPQIWRIQSDHRKQVDRATVGDIIGIVGLHHSITGDTLCHPQHPIVLESITFPETVISMAIEPETTTERKKLAGVLDMLRRQDPTFQAIESEETGQTLISGMGELHLEVIKHRLLRDYNLDVKVHNPRVSYRETIQRAVEVTGQCHRTMAGRQLSASVTIRMEPRPDGPSRVQAIPACGDALPPEFLTPALETLSDHGEGTGLLGFPLMHVRISVLGGKVHETESNDMAFRMAAGDAFEKGLREAGMVLLEPIMHLEVTTPEESLGEIVSDLQQRRA
ncbi:MAG: elongation factor G, partial [Candidatus Nealsonbacteria bacterium]|nr:elongation factor G [Candidatus Nealsonbacteria bacterium]